MHTKLERLLSKSLTTLEVMTYYLVVHTGPGLTADGVGPRGTVNCFEIVDGDGGGSGGCDIPAVCWGLQDTSRSHFRRPW